MQVQLFPKCILLRIFSLAIFGGVILIDKSSPSHSLEPAHLHLHSTTSYLPPTSDYNTESQHSFNGYNWIVETIYIIFSLMILTHSITTRTTSVIYEEKSPVKSRKTKNIEKGEDDSDADLSSSIIGGKWWKPSNTHLMVYTVPRYPENHNPFLPLSLQQQLDNMNPREFLTYVLKDLTLEERESLMVDERQRRKTFLVNWPYDDQRSGIKMAQAGFYSLDAYDRVQCVFCRGSLHRWDSGDTPMIEHARSFTFCRFVKGLECGNREYRSDMLSEDDITNITRFQNPTNHERQRRTHSESIDSGLLGISTTKAALIRYAPDATRLRTFARWPASCPITARRMCDAGFYYTGFEDQVRCFYCSGGIKQWSERDDPWEEHARWFPDCAFLAQQKGQPYINEVHARTPSNKKSVRKTKSQKTAEAKEIDNKNTLQDMRKVCLRLGHSPNSIDRVLRINGKPFDNISAMIDALYSDDSNGTEAIVEQSTQLLAPRSLSLTCPEEDLHKLQNQEGASAAPGTFNGNETHPHHKMACRKCELTTENFVPATHVGLPCGHLIYCESCNNEEKRKSSNSNYVVKCPFHRCGAPLTGSIRVYFA